MSHKIPMGTVLVPAALVLAVVLAVAPAPVQAAPARTVTLSVENMTCAMCPITVRKALEKVPGVIRAEATYVGETDEGTGRAKVTFDPDRTDIEALTKATREAGYPSQPKEKETGDGEQP